MKERMFKLPTTLDASPTLDVDGQRVEFTERGLLPEAVREKARQALASGEPLRMTIRALAGHISKPFAFTPEFLQSLADTAPGSPLFKRVHDGSLLSIIREPQVEGVIERARPIENGLDADIAVHGEEALREMAMGVAPTYSIQWRSGPGSTLTCSACGEPYAAHDWESDHEPGDVVDGKRVDVIFGGKGQLVETTRTYTPAADGTHVRSVQLSDDLLERASRWLADNPAARQTIARALQERPMSDPKITPAPEPAATLSDDERAELTRLRSTVRANDEILAELLAEKEERTLAAQRKLAFGELSRTGLKLTVDRLCEILAEPTADGVREVLAATPSRSRVGIPPAGDPPDYGEELVTPAQLRAQATALAERNGTDARAELIRMTNEAQKAGRLVV